MKKLVSLDIKVKIPKGKKTKSSGLMLPKKKKLYKDKLGKSKNVSNLKEDIKPFGKK